MTTPETGPRSPADGTRRTPRGRLAMFVLGVALSGCALGDPAASAQLEDGGAAAADPITFERYEVIADSTAPRTVVTGLLLDGAVADLAMLHIDAHDERHLRVFRFDGGGWSPGLHATLGADVSFVDVARIGGRDRLVTYAPGRLRWFDPESATERELVAVTCPFDPPRRGELPHVDITRDLNGDDRDDLVVPGADGFQVFVQRSDGAFADPVRVGGPPELAGISGADGYRYDAWGQSRVHVVDYDGDGRNDLVSWNDDHFEAHLQDGRGLFAPEPVRFTTEVDFDSDDLFSLATGDMTGRVLHSLADLNADGVADLVLCSLQGKRISSKQSAYELHFGALTPDRGTLFAPDVDIAFRSEDRIQLALDRRDFDGDGLVDLMFTTIARDSVQGSLWKSLKGLMGDDIGLQLEFYRNADGSYADAPDAIRSIGLDGTPSHREPGSVPLALVLRGATHESRRTETGWPRAFNPTLLIGDVTGDGRTDLVMEDTFRGLALWPGVPGPSLFAPTARPIEVIVPSDNEFTWLTDMNRDGKQDILLHHPFTLRDIHGGRRRPPGTERHRVTLLITE